MLLIFNTQTNNGTILSSEHFVHVPVKQVMPIFFFPVFVDQRKIYNFNESFVTKCCFLKQSSVCSTTLFTVHEKLDFLSSEILKFASDQRKPFSCKHPETSICSFEVLGIDDTMFLLQTILIEENKCDRTNCSRYDNLFSKLEQSMIGDLHLIKKSLYEDCSARRTNQHERVDIRDVTNFLQFLCIGNHNIGRTNLSVHKRCLECDHAHSKDSHVVIKCFQVNCVIADIHNRIFRLLDELMLSTHMYHAETNEVLSDKYKNFCFVQEFIKEQDASLMLDTFSSNILKTIGGFYCNLSFIVLHCICFFSPLTKSKKCKKFIRPKCLVMKSDIQTSSKAFHDEDCTDVMYKTCAPPPTAYHENSCYHENDNGQPGKGCSVDLVCV